MALTGWQDKDSHFSTGTKTRDGDFGLLQSYLSFVTQKAIHHGGSPGDTAAWLVDRDRQTRSAARSLFMKGWSFAEALKQARQHECGVLWQIDRVRNGGPGLIPDTAQAVAALTNFGQEQPPAPATPTRLQRGEDRGSPHSPKPVLNATLMKANLCDAFNDHRGCSQKQRDCPESKLHRCNMDLGSGAVCGAWQHNRLVCPHTVPAPPGSQYAKVKTGKGGKGAKGGKGGKGR
jgi:hypothetical protein